ncbi:MAG: rhomboid family intramembrane serine protease [bacterium]|nr:rhomboid family intramembrane serine protease [bacterium]
MRFLGEIEGQAAAEKFVAYLLTKEIDTHIELARSESDQWELWIRNEDQLDAARDELQQFEANRNDPRYTAAVSAAKKILGQKERARREASKNVRRIESNQRSLTSGGKLPPLTLTLFVLCILVGLLTNFSSPGPGNGIGRQILEQLSFVGAEDYRESGGNPAASLMKGQVWRAITPIFLHLGILHLAMNMFMFFHFGRMVERWIGTPRYAVMVLAMAVLPNLLQGLSPEWMHGSHLFGGISGVLYGLFAYVWVRTSINPSHGISIPFPYVVILVGLIVVGLSGAVPGWRLADLCHLGGLLVGAAFGFAAEQSSTK